MSRLIVSACRTAIALFISVLLTEASAASWDAATDFSQSTSVNPNGVWSYGYDPSSITGYQFKAFNLFSTQGDLLFWQDSSYISLGDPAFLKNISSSTLGGFFLPAQIGLHPGPASNGDAAILRFTAPVTAMYLVHAQFFAGDVGETDAWVILSNNFSNPLNSLGVTSANPSFDSPGLALNAGESLDFVVGNHGSYFNDTTPIVVQISAVPEPSSSLLMICGIAAFGRVIQRRR